MSITRVVVMFAFLAGATTAAAQQCPDGSRPPCTTAPAARANPPLDARRWIVLPFTNNTRAADVEWLSATSVNFLSLDLSRWTDIRVVEAERVTDLLRELPDALRRQLGQEAGFSVARRAGAAHLVVGEYLTQGQRTTVTARVFDVRTGARVRLATEVALHPDSITTAYQRLALRVIDVPLPAGTRLNGLGTSSIGAVRAYALGKEASERWRTDSAIVHFARAVEFDSAFALAQASLAGVLGRSGEANAARVQRARDAAERASSNLPERERTIIALARATDPVRCSFASRLLALDSADSRGWRELATCIVNDKSVVLGNDGRARRSVSLNAARVALERSLDLLPTAGAALDLLGLYLRSSDQRFCPPAATACPDSLRSDTHWAVVVLDGDTLATHFELARRFDPPWRRRSFDAGRQAMLVAGRDVGARWVAANPRDLLARFQYGSFLLRLGDPLGAERELSAAQEFGAITGEVWNRPLFNNLLAELAWKRGTFDRALALADSAGIRAWNTQVAFGRFGAASATEDPFVRGVPAAYLAAYAGVVAADFEQVMRAYATAEPARRQVIHEVGTMLAFHTLRRRAGADSASEFPLFRFQAHFARGDTTRARQALGEYDRLGAERADHIWDAYEMFSAESYAALGDTTMAWARIEPFARRWMSYQVTYGSFWASTDGLQGLRNSAGVIGRAWLLYADLAIATGHFDEARRGYATVVAMWEKGDAPVQPLVKRAREALVKLGAP